MNSMLQSLTLCSIIEPTNRCSCVLSRATVDKNGCERIAGCESISIVDFSDTFQKMFLQLSEFAIQSPGYLSCILSYDSEEWESGGLEWESVGLWCSPQWKTMNPGP